MATYQGIQLTKSPYYITEAGASGFTSTIEIRIWSGAIASEPTAYTYELVKQALAVSDTSVTFEISKIVESSFSHLPNPADLSASQRTEGLWVNVKSFDGDTNRDDTWLATDGYTDFLDGINYEYTGSTLISESILYHYTGFPVTLPVHTEGSTKAVRNVFKKDGGIVSIDSYAGFTGSTNSYDKIQYTSNNSFPPGSYDSVEVQDGTNSVLQTLTIVDGICSKYDLHLVSFINKFGVYQELMFSLVSKETIRVKKKSYNSQTLEISGGVPSYNVGKHKFKDYNASVKESITLNTNYIDESLNDTIGELISSEAVWVTVDGVTSPVNVSTNSLTYKKDVNEGLINYTINFDYAFNKRNTVY